MLCPANEDDFTPRNMPSIVEQHVPCSIALAYSGDEGNVEHPDWLVSDGDTETLIAEFVGKMLSMHEKHVANQTVKYEAYLKQFEDYEQQVDPSTPTEYHFQDTEKIVKLCTRKWLGRNASSVDKLRRQFYAFVYKLPILGYNSSSYDLNVLREWLFPLLVESAGGGRMVQAAYKKLSILKRRNRYLCIETPHFKFVDAYLFVAAGTSLKAFMRSQLPHGQAAGLCKLEFPYRYLSNLPSTQ